MELLLVGLFMIFSAVSAMMLIGPEKGELLAVIYSAIMGVMALLSLVCLAIIS